MTREDEMIEAYSAEANMVSPQRNMKHKIKILIVGYILMAAMTYGYAYNQRLKFENEHFPKWEATNRIQAEGDGVMCAMLWPLYWPFHISRQMWANDQAERLT